MKPINILTKSLTGGLFAAAFAISTARADDVPPVPPPPPGGVDTLETTVISAGKFPQAQSDVGSAVTLLDPREMVDLRQIRSLEQALTLSPGVIVTSSGARGSTSSVFLRGVNSNQTQ